MTSNNVSVLLNDEGRPYIANVGPAVTYNEGDAPLQLLANTTTVSDPDSPDFRTGSLVVSGGRGTHDRLAIRDAGSGPGQIDLNRANVRYQGVFIGSFSGGVGTDPLVVSLGQNATPEAAAALLKAITFYNVNTNNLKPIPRTIRFELHDGEGNTGAVTKNITLVRVNDAPLLRGISGNVGYTIGAGAIQIAPAANVSDVDSPDFAGGRLTVQITSGAHGSNRLLIGGGFSVNANNEVLQAGVVIGTVNAGGGVGTARLVFVFNENANRSVVQQLIRGLRFRTVGSATAVDRVVAFTLTDGDDGTSATRTKTVQVQ